MDREVVFFVLGTVTLGPLLLLAGVQRAGEMKASSGCGLERVCWCRLWRPLLPSAIVFSALVGWALVEPDDAERLPFPLIAIGAPFAFVWIRAIVRALWGLRRARPTTAATVGVFRPHVVIAPAFWRSLDDSSRHAVRAHEDAHVRYRDPMRVWAARLATDLQWGRHATHRFAEWRHALELARDEAVRREGVDGADLAAAVIAALQFCPVNASPAVSIAGDRHGVRDRITRLLAPLPATYDEPAWSHAWRASTIAAPIGAVMFGASFGEAIVRTLVHTIR